jgi:predicted ATP-grasp superfamily ATP-dependent carboligase
VTGASYRALAVVRSLGRRGVPVHLVRTDEQAVATGSRYAAGAVAWPRGHGSDRVGWLEDLAEREGLEGWVLIPTHDEEAAFVARHRDRLARRFRLTTPPWTALRDAYDKRRTHAVAGRLGLAQPWTILPGAGDPLELAAGRFPVVLKPAFKASHNRLTADKAWQADDLPSLRARHAQACGLVDPRILMVQELVPGGGATQLSVAALCDDGDVVASVTARRTRQYPMGFGRASSHVETIEDGRVLRAARRLLAALRWTGMAEVEFKRDARTGADKLLDVNPRAWGWQSLCGRAGVDFPWLLWLQACGRPVPPTRAAPGVRWVRMGTDVAAVAGEVRAGRLSPRGYARSLRRPLEFAVFARDDPLPAVLGPLHTARLVGGRLAAGRPV